MDPVGRLLMRVMTGGPLQGSPCLRQVQWRMPDPCLAPPPSLRYHLVRRLSMLLQCKTNQIANTRSIQVGARRLGLYSSASHGTISFYPYEYAK